MDVLDNAIKKLRIDLWNWHGTLIFLFGLSFTTRCAVRWYTGEQDFWENGYRFFFVVAQNIAVGNGISLVPFVAEPTTFRVPLYPLFLAAVTFGHQSFFPVLLAQSLIGAGTVVCAALIAR